MNKLILAFIFSLSQAFGADDTVTNTSNIIIKEASPGTNKITIRPPSFSTDYSLTWPAVAPTSGQYLTATSSSDLSFATLPSYDISGAASAAVTYSVQRANHTGTQLAATISNFDTQVAATAALKSNNLSDVTASTARTNLGLGSAAIVSSASFDLSGVASAAQSYAVQRANHTGTQTASTISDFNTQVATTAALKANNLSDVTASTARTNLGLGTAALVNVASFDLSGAASSAVTLSAQRASNLSDLASADASRTNLGVGKYDSPRFLGLSVLGNVGIGNSAPGSSLDISGGLRLRGFSSGSATLQMPATSATTSYTLPSADGTSGTVLSTNGSGILSWSAAGAGSGDFKADGSVIMTGALAASSGIATLPGITFSGDTDTGIWRPAANTVALSTNALERMRVDLNGSVGIGTTAPNASLDVKGPFRISTVGATTGAKFTMPATAASVSYTLPSADGSNGSMLGTDGAGNLNWVGNSGSGDWSTATCTSSFVANTTTTCKYKCLGPRTVRVDYSLAFTGAPTATALTANMPIIFTPDPTAAPGGAGTYIGGFAQWYGQDSGVQDYTGNGITSITASAATTNSQMMKAVGAVNATSVWSIGNTDNFFIMADFPVKSCPP